MYEENQQWCDWVIVCIYVYPREGENIQTTDKQERIVDCFILQFTKNENPCIHASMLKHSYVTEKMNVVVEVASETQGRGVEIWEGLRGIGWHRETGKQSLDFMHAPTHYRETHHLQSIEVTFVWIARQKKHSHHTPISHPQCPERLSALFLHRWK